MEIEIFKKLRVSDEFLLRVFLGTEKILKFLEEWDTFGYSLGGLLENRVLYSKARNAYLRKMRKKYFSQFLRYLKKKGWVKISTLKEKKALLLTEKGKEKILSLKWKLLKERFKEEKPQKRKDGKWIMVVFDIPEKERQKRDIFRDALLGMGFTFFQKSIWISPFDVLDKLEKIIRNLEIWSYVRVFLIEEKKFK